MDISEIIKQDMKAVITSLDSDDYRLMNVFSNRLMSNSILEEKPEFNYTLIGFFSKEVSRICSEIKTEQNNSAYNTAKAIAISYLKSIEIKSENEILWQDFCNFYDRIRKYEIQKTEKDSYRDSQSFTASSFSVLLRIIQQQKEVLYYTNNQFVAGVTTEMERIIRVHGGKLNDIYLISLFRALSFYSAYINYLDKENRNEFISKSIIPYIDSILEVSKDFIPNKITELLTKIINDWRIRYIQFLERPRFVPIDGQKVAITEDTKRKVSETVEKALQQEVS